MPKPQLCARSPPPAGASRSLRPTIYDTTRARDDRKVCRARARGVAPSSRASSRVAPLVMMHPRVRHKHVDYRTGEVSLTTSKREARELVYFTRGRDGPLFISDRLCACDVSLLRASARVCDGARFACYVSASILLRRSLSATKPV